tara:strand:- start:49820 stop:50191 length:372 start_codon:yes stop_codon:yes gene_type:complete
MALPTNCQNPECDKIFQRKNSKQIYCSLNCKNRANYIKFSIENADEIIWQKNYKKNAKIVDDIYTTGIRKVYKTTLNQIGFDKNYLKCQKKTTKGVAYFEVGMYWLIDYSIEEYEIQKILQNE